MALVDRQRNVGYLLGSAYSWTGTTLPALGQDSTGVTDFLGAIMELTSPVLGNNNFKLVFNNGANTAATASGVVVYYCDATMLQVSTSLSDGVRDTAAGVCVSAIPIGGYGWIQTYGLNIVKAGSGTFAYGIKVVSDATAGQVVSLTAGTAYTYTAVGTALATTGAAWAASTVYAVGALVKPLTSPNGYWFLATTGGTSGATEPTWPTIANVSVTDGTVTWQSFAGSTSGTYAPVNVHVGLTGPVV